MLGRRGVLKLSQIIPNCVYFTARRFTAAKPAMPAQELQLSLSESLVFLPCFPHPARSISINYSRAYSIASFTCLVKDLWILSAAEDRPIRAGHLIRIDWTAGAVAGVLMLSLRGWLTGLYALPGELLLVIGLANLAYASVSFTLAMLRRGDRVPYLRALAVANILWAIGCLGLAAVWFGQASVFGMGQLIGEALFVGGLGVLEWQAAGRGAARQGTPNGFMAQQT